MGRQTATWAVVGTSPSARRFLPLVPEDVTTMATNAAIELFEDRRLDYYWLCDQQACQTHGQDAYAAQARGTKLVTLYRRSERAMAERNLTGFDLFLRLNIHRKPFARGEELQDLRLSGLYALAFAVNHGAQRVLMLGLEGYQNHQAGKVTLIIRPITQAIIDACGDVQFHFLGSPRYEIHGPNLTIHEVPDASAIRQAMEGA